MSNTFGIISLIFGIIGLCCGWFIPLPYVAWIIPIVAIICGIIGIIRDDSKGMAIAGLILGILSIVLVGFFLSLLIGLFVLVLNMFTP